MTGEIKNIQMKFGDGRVSEIDQDTYKLIVSLQKEINNPRGLPLFWNLKNGISGYDDAFLDFYSFALAHRKMSRSQLFQDVFALFSLDGKERGSFLEFGATNGVELSNSLMLETHFGWTGVLAEPSPQWHQTLRENRPNTKIITDCIYSGTGLELDFFVSETGVLSTLEDFRDSDRISMPGNAKARNASGYTTKVTTISLNDVFLRYFGGAKIDYMSIDTEGSELTILKSFDFAKFGPRVVTVEHNFSDTQKKLDALFAQNGYQRVFREHTQFDAWYVLQG